MTANQPSDQFTDFPTDIDHEGLAQVKNRPGTAPLSKQRQSTDPQRPKSSLTSPTISPLSDSKNSAKLSFGFDQEEAKQQLEELMKQGSVKVHTTKCLVLGIAGVGETHLKRLLLSEHTDTDGRMSTGLADNPVQILVGSLNSMLANVEEGTWEVLDETKLMQVLANAYEVQPSPPKSSESTPRKALSSPVPCELQNKQAFEEAFSVVINALKTRIDAKKWEVNLVNFIDSGGQPEFLDIMPAFIHDVSVILFAVNLSEKLDQCPMICFYKDNKPLRKPYQSPASHRQVLERCVRAAHARDVHPNVFVVGTHRDMANQCQENKTEKDKIITEVIGVNKRYLICKNGTEIMYDINGEKPDSDDETIAAMLRQSIMEHRRDDLSIPSIPLKWFCFEMSVRRAAPQGVVSMNTCQQLAQRLDMDEKDLKTSLLHMVKFNLFLWYHDVEALRDAVFSDPQVILKIITALVQCKHEFAGDNDAAHELFHAGINRIWIENIRDHGVVSLEFLSLKQFKGYFVDHIFTVEHFIALMCHLFIMVPLDNGDYLMPALLDPLSPEKICRTPSVVAPLLVCFPNGCVPHGMFGSLLAFLQKECDCVKEKNVPVCLYSNCASFEHKTFPGKFCIIDSVSHIEVHLESSDHVKACSRIRKLIHKGIESCAQVLHYTSWKQLGDGFFCSTESCRHAAMPYKDTPQIAKCSSCSHIMDLTDTHTVWFQNEVIPCETVEDYMYTHEIVDKVIRDMYSRIRECLPNQLNDVIGRLYSDLLLTEEVHVCLIQGDEKSKRDKLLAEVQSSIKVEPKRLRIFLGALENINREPLVNEIKDSLKKEAEKKKKSELELKKKSIPRTVKPHVGTEKPGYEALKHFKKELLKCNFHCCLDTLLKKGLIDKKTRYSMNLSNDDIFKAIHQAINHDDKKFTIFCDTLKESKVCGEDMLKKLRTQYNELMS